MRTFTLVALTATLIFSGNTFGQEALIGDCGCQGSNIAPVVYQEPMVENSLEGAVIEAGVGSVEPVADSASVVDSPIIDSATTYEGAPMAQGEMIIEGTPMAEGEVIVEGDSMGQGEMIVEGDSMAATPSCGCQSAAAPVTYESTPVFTSAASVPTPCCNTPARRGFFSRVFGR